MSEVLKRLEEIEIRRLVNDPDMEWLCARLRDALTVIRIVNPWSRDESVIAAYRRLFEEEESRGE